MTRGKIVGYCLLAVLLALYVVGAVSGTPGSLRHEVQTLPLWFAIVAGCRFLMSLTPGTRLGPYEVQSAIGAGGMGEVYRARDSRLRRDVAIKILPEAFAADPDRIARFQREAELLAALNHPNVACVYG